MNLNLLSRQSQLDQDPEATGSCLLDQEHWVENHGDCLFRYALGQVRNPSVAEDLVQETFLAALRAHGRFNGRSTERTWLVGILRHKIVDHLRASRRFVSVSHGNDGSHDDRDDAFLLWMHEAAADCVTPHRHLELSEFRSALEAALGALPPRLAQVFQMYEMEERSGQEVCHQMDISASNLWVMLHRARHQMRSELAEWIDQGIFPPVSSSTAVQA